jgi:hypothetical protein
LSSCWALHYFRERADAIKELNRQTKDGILVKKSSGSVLFKRPTNASKNRSKVCANVNVFGSAKRDEDVGKLSTGHC